jgi:hypothetical protein
MQQKADKIHRATIEQGSPKFLPPEERIAAFDQDGTLWVSHSRPAPLPTAWFGFRVGNSRWVATENPIAERTPTQEEFPTAPPENLFRHETAPLSNF